MPYLTLKNNKISPILIEFDPQQKVQTIKTQIENKFEGKEVEIVLYFNDKRIDVEKTFEELHIHGGNVLIYLTKSGTTEISEMTESDKIIEMMKQNYTYQQSVIALKRSSYDLQLAFELVKQDDLTDCTSESDDESMSEFLPTPHIDINSKYYSSSDDDAEELCSDAFKDSESINQ